MVGGWAFFPLNNMHPSKGKVSYIETRKEATVSGVLQKRWSWKFHQIRRKTIVSESFFNKVADLRAATLLKKDTPTQVFFCESGELFNSTVFKKTPALLLQSN